MTRIDFRPFDADNHYYEAEDSFTRHVDKQMQKRAVQWALVGGRKRILVGGKLDRFIPNPTFDPITRPGVLEDYFRGINPQGKSQAELFAGNLEPIRPEYRDRDARVKLLDEQGIESVLLFPTLACGVEEQLRRDVAATHAALRGFNRWLLEDWGFAYQERLFGVPLLSLADPAEAVKELEWALGQGARVVYLRPAPVPKGEHSASLGHRDHDPFWARVNEAGITVAFHAGDTGYGRYSAAWATGGESHQGVEAFRAHVFGVATGLGRYILDTMAALICHGVFQRFPNVRVCSIENGSFWVPWLFKNLKKAYGQEPKAFRESPIETFRRHISVAPYFEDDVAELVRLIGVEQVLFGSDFPHAEGLRDPLSFVHELKDQSDEDVRKIMRENQRKLVTLRPGLRGLTAPRAGGGRRTALLLRAASASLGVGLALAAAELVGALGLHALKQPPSLPPELRAQVRLAGRSTATVPDPYLGYRVRPDWDDDGHAHTNQYGLREGPIDPRPGPGVLRILLLGGSTAWSYTARSNEEALSAQLERELESRREESPALRGLRIEVLNGGVPGYVSWQSALLYDLHLGALGSQVVISLDGSNDVSSAIKNGEAGVPARYELTKRSYLDERPRLLRDLWHWLAYRVQRTKLALFVRQLEAPSVEELGAPPPEDVAGAYRAALVHLADAARRDGALAMGVFQPVSVLAEGKPLAAFEAAVNAHEDADMPGRSDYFRACAAAVRATFGELASERPDLLLLDATHAFDGVEEITFADPAHLMPAGQRHLARAIAAPLLERLERDGKPGSVGGAALGLVLAAQREDGLHGGDHEP